jgi:cytochrome c oxidase assembly factor CtaG
VPQVAGAVTPANVWHTWPRDPAVALVLAAAAAGYAVGLHRIRARAGRRVVTRWQVASFWAGLAVVAVALLSPVDTVSEALLSIHMVQHILIGLLAPLLLAVGAPATVMAWALRPATRRELRRMGRRVPVVGAARRSSAGVAAAAVVLHTAAFWGWHAPPVYDLALRHDLVHALEHEALFASGLLLWWVVVATRWRERSASAVVWLFLAALQGGAMAALLTLAPRPFYAAHLSTTAAWHLTPLADQQLAGAIMWVPGGLVYLVPAVVLFARWLQSGPGSHRAVRWAPDVALSDGGPAA